jgi:hypothetical protein
LIISSIHWSMIWAESTHTIITALRNYRIILSITVSSYQLPYHLINYRIILSITVSSYQLLLPICLYHVISLIEVNLQGSMSTHSSSIIFLSLYDRNVGVPDDKEFNNIKSYYFLSNNCLYKLCISKSDSRSIHLSKHN